MTLNPDGSPQASAIWVGLDGDEIVSGHMAHWLKVRNVERDLRVLLSIEGRGLNAIGLREYLVVHGHARVQQGGAAELLQRVGHVPARRRVPRRRLRPAHHAGAHQRGRSLGDLSGSAPSGV